MFLFIVFFLVWKKKSKGKSFPLRIFMENPSESPFLESTLLSLRSVCNISSSPADMQQNSLDWNDLTKNQLVLLLHDNNLREMVMCQLIKVYCMFQIFFIYIFLNSFVYNLMFVLFILYMCLLCIFEILRQRNLWI